MYTIKLIIYLFIFLFISKQAYCAEYARVLYVIDGDTIVVKYHKKKEKIRLLGIDTLETKDNYRAYVQSKQLKISIKQIIKRGNKAKKYVKRILKKGTKVRLEFDKVKRDNYKRLLAYVWLPGRVMLNEKILKAGHAKLMIIAPNKKYKKRLTEVFKKAKKRKNNIFKKIKLFVFLFSFHLHKFRRILR